MPLHTSSVAIEPSAMPVNVRSPAGQVKSATPMINGMAAVISSDDDPRTRDAARPLTAEYHRTWSGDCSEIAPIYRLMMSTKSLVAVAAVAAALVVSAGFPLAQGLPGGAQVSPSASPCPPFMPCQGPPKPPKLPDFGGGPGPKGPKLPDFGGGPGPKGPKLPDFGGGPGPKGPKLPDLVVGPGPKGPNLPDFGGGPGLKGPKLPGPADVRHAFTVGGPPAGARINVPGALRVPKDFRPDFRLHVPGLGRLNPDAHINFRWPGGPAARLRGDFRVGVPWLIRPRDDFGLNFHWPWPGRVPADLRRGFYWRVSPADLRIEFRVGHVLDFSADWRGLRLRLGPATVARRYPAVGNRARAMGLGTTAATGLGRVDTAAVGAGSGTLHLLGFHRDPGVGSLLPAVGILGIRSLDPVAGPIGAVRSPLDSKRLAGRERAAVGDDAVRPRRLVVFRSRPGTNTGHE